MSIRWLCRLMPCCTLLLIVGGHAAQPKLSLVTEEYPPYNMSAEPTGVTGVSTDIVRELMRVLDYSYEITLYPWARAIQMALVQANTCVFSMSRTPEREDLYQWIGPIVSNDWALFSSEPNKTVASIEAIQPARIGSYQGDAIVGYLQKRGFNVDVAPTDEANPRKLLAKRIDYWATGKLIGQYRLKQQGIKGVEPVLVFNRTEMYLACNKKMADEQVAKLNRALTDMKNSGFVRRVYAAYGYIP